MLFRIVDVTVNVFNIAFFWYFVGPIWLVYMFLAWLLAYLIFRRRTMGPRFMHKLVTQPYAFGRLNRKLVRYLKDEAEKRNNILLKICYKLVLYGPSTIFIICRCVMFIIMIIKSNAYDKIFITNEYDHDNEAMILTILVSC